MLAEECAMVPSAVPTRMLGAEELWWLTGAYLLKKMPEAPVLATPAVWSAGRWAGLVMGGLQDKETERASL